MLGSPSGSSNLGSHSSAPDIHVDVYRNGAKIKTNTAVKIDFARTCAGRLSSGAATGDWQDGDIITLYTP